MLELSWSNVGVANVITDFITSGYAQPRINNVSKDTLVTSYGLASTNGQAGVGVYYNICAASASTYCYEYNSGIDIPDTIMDISQDICPANWRMPTGSNKGEYQTLAQKYSTVATNPDSIQYNLSISLSGCYSSSFPTFQGDRGFLWSSTFDDANDMYYLEAGLNYLHPDINGNDRDFGQSIRCLVHE